jgi:hypothetical protein
MVEDDDVSEKPPATKTIHGRIHGKTIELDEELGVAEGQEVEVQVTIVQPARKCGEGILRSAVGWVEYPEMDAIMERIQQDRKVERRPQMGDE